MKYLITIFFTLLILNTFAQIATVVGTVKDAETGEFLVGVNIVYGATSGMSTDIKGHYEFQVKPGTYKISFSYVGYESQTEKLTLTGGQKRELKIKLKPVSSILDEVVITAGRHKQKRTDVTVSMELIKPEFIFKNNTTSLETAIEKIPGVMVTDEQVSIRGGSGYSYGVGSRVLLLVDGLPLMTGASGEAKWEFIPVDNISRVEVIKGASSVLYGSSALNGVINVRTRPPANKPETKITTSLGVYGNPKRKEIKWWGPHVQSFENVRFYHSRKVKNLDLTIGGGGYFDDGFKMNENNDKYNAYMGMAYNFRKVEGLRAGVNVNYLSRKGDMFLLWKDGDTGVYQPSASFMQTYDIKRLSVDPFIEYLGKNNTKQSLKNRFYRIENKNNTAQGNTDYLYYGEYQFQKYMENMTLAAGFSGTWYSSISELYGKSSHAGYNAAAFVQADKKIGNLNISAGARYEYNSLDGQPGEGMPIFRSGLNYQMAEYSFLRASFGQGFRYPSIAEKYTVTQVGDLKIFPNDSLQPETGWSAEIGFIQGFEAGNLKGMFDIAVFWTQYSNMIEFMFGQHYPDWVNPQLLYLDTFLKYTGFKAYNISNTRIRGVDISTTGKYQIEDITFSYLAGYTFTDPVELNFDSTTTTNSTSKNILKYRFYHNFKADLDMAYKKFSAGINVDYHSFVINIDNAFEDSIRLPSGFPVTAILPGLKSYREEHNTGDIVFDFRFEYKISEKQNLLFLIRNAFNREYIIRPGDVQAPRNYSLQYTLKF